MTCRTLLTLISAAVVWNLSHNIMAQAKQEGSEQGPGTATDAKDPAAGGSAVLQMQAKKKPAKPKAKAKLVKTPARPVKPKSSGKAPVKAAPKPVTKPNPYFPSESEGLFPVEELPADNPRFQVPLPEEKGDLNIWATDPAAATEARNQFGLIGVGNYLGTGFGLEYMRRSLSWMDWGLQVTSTQAALSESKNPETDEFLDAKMTSARLSARFFSSRWLYVSTALGFNSIQGSFGWKGAGVANNEISTDFKADLISLDVAIGSQWEPGKGFYIGVDWIGLGLPLSGTITYDTNEDLDDITRVLTGATAEERIRNELSAQFRPFYMLVKIGYML